MSDLISFNPVRALDANGNPVAGARAFFYLSGTTEPATVFADPEETTPHPVPLEADAEGIFPPVFRSGQPLKVDVQTPGGDILNGFPLDPVLTVPASGAAASQVSFDPTENIPGTNVQAAIERVQENLVEPLLAGGIGVTGNAEILSNVDATDTASGFYRFTTNATGTLPSVLQNSNGVIYLIRRTSSNAWQFAGFAGGDRFYMRRLFNGEWQTWREWTHDGTFYRGLGLRNNQSADFVSDFNDTTLRSGFYRFGGNTTGPRPVSVSSGNFGYIFVYRSRQGYILQELEARDAVTSVDTYRRKYDGETWGQWQSLNSFNSEQAWQDLSGSRSFGTSYQNTSGKSIMVAISISTGDADGGAVVEASSNGQDWVNLSGSLNVDNGKKFSFVVPVDGHYRILRDNDPQEQILIGRWVELR